jgi:hypothetical protein
VFTLWGEGGGILVNREGLRSLRSADLITNLKTTLNTFPLALILYFRNYSIFDGSLFTAAVDAENLLRQVSEKRNFSTVLLLVT